MYFNSNLRHFARYCISDIITNRVLKHTVTEEHNSCFVEYAIYPQKNKIDG